MRTRSRIFARFSQVIEDETSGIDRLYYSDYSGQLWELDSPDVPTDDYGATRSGFSTVTGTVQADAGNSTLQLKLVGDSSLPTTADGLRGVELSVNGERRRIASNDANIVVLESDLLAGPVRERSVEAGRDPRRLRDRLHGHGRLDARQAGALHRVVECSLFGLGDRLDRDGGWGTPAQVFDDRDMGVQDTRFGPVLGRGAPGQGPLRGRRPRESVGGRAGHGGVASEGEGEMVSLRQWTETLARLQRFGRSGRWAKQAPVERSVDELAREITELRQALELVVRHQRFGPDWEQAFLIRAADADANGNVVLQHDLGFTPNHFSVVRIASTVAAGAPPANWGFLRLLQSDPREVTFQLDGSALANSMSFKVCLTRGIFVQP